MVDAAFTDDDPVTTLWVKAYQGEFSGELLFSRYADSAADPEHARKMQVLSTLERRTREALVSSLERAGISTEADPEELAGTEALAAALSDVSWEDFLASFEPITTQFLAVYRRIGELDPSESAAAELLVAHEVALREFARRELAGSPGTSLEPITALPHMQ